MDNLGLLLSKLQHEIEQEILFHLGDVGKFTPSDLHRLEQLQRMSVSMEDINANISKACGEGLKQIEMQYQQEAMEYYNDNKSLFFKSGTHFIPFEQNRVVQSFVQVIAERTKNEFKNITGSLGFVGENGVPMPLADYYRETLDYAMAQVYSGTYDYNRAIRGAVKKLSDNGMQWVQYGDHWRNRATVAVRRAVFTGNSQVQEEINRRQGSEFGADGMEVSWHRGYRPTHNFGGKQFTMAEYDLTIKSRLLDYNCRHQAFPIILGISKAVYTKPQLKKMIAEENRKVDYQGKSFNKYEQTQRQRQLETAIRLQKERINAFKATGDKEALGISQSKLQVLNKRYKSFSEHMELPLQPERTWVYGYDGKSSRIFNLTEKEDYAIKNYISSGSYTLNENLRAGTLTEQDRLMVENLDKALSKMPEYKGTAHRSLSGFGIESVEEFLDKYIVGEVTTFKNYTSASVGMVYDDNFPIQYVIEAKTAKDLRIYNDNEQEVLFKRNTTFKIVKVRENTIYLEEE